jgi:hypothetical protein
MADPCITSNTPERRVLWALEIDDGWPVRAHFVVERDEQARRYKTACGMHLSWSFYGCWELPEGEMPLQERFVCCRDPADQPVPVSEPF